MSSAHEHACPAAAVQSSGAACVAGGAGAESPPSIDICIIDEAIRPESCSGRLRCRLDAAEVRGPDGAAQVEAGRGSPPSL